MFCLFFAKKSAVEVFIWSFTYIFDKNGRVIEQDMKEIAEKKEQKEDFSDLL